MVQQRYAGVVSQRLRHLLIDYNVGTLFKIHTYTASCTAQKRRQKGWLEAEGLAGGRRVWLEIRL